MQKIKILFTLLLLGSGVFTIVTSLGNLHEHASHLLFTIFLQVICISCIWKEKLNRSSFALFALFLFVSVHVIPTGMLIGHHDSHHQTEEHQSQHACCIPVMPVSQIGGLDSVLGYIQEIPREQKRIHALASIISDTGRSPPLV